MKKTAGYTLLTFFIFALLFTLVGCTNRDNAAEQTYSTPEEAILKCLEVNGIRTTSEELEEVILDSIKVNKINYYLLKGIHESTPKNTIYVFLVGVMVQNDAKYICEKVTADFSLESIDEVEDAEYTSYSEYIIPIENLYIHVGMIFKPNYHPYFMGKKLSLDEDNIFFCKTKDAEAEIEIRKI